MKPDDPVRMDWRCVEPSSLEHGVDPNDVRVCPPGQVPTASERVPLRKKVGLAFDALRKMFRYAEDMRRTKSPPR